MNKVIWWGILTALSAVALLTTTGRAEVRKYGDVKDVDWKLGAPAQYPEANAVVVFDCVAITVTTDDIERKYHCRTKVLTQAGIEEAGEASFYYDNDYDKIRDFKAQTITPDGKKHKVEKDAIFDKQSGWRTERTFAFPAVTIGSIVEYEYTIGGESFHYLAPWYFQNRFYTMESICSVELPNGFTYDAKCYNVPYRQQKPTVTERLDINRVNAAGADATIKTYTWTLTDIMPAVDEPYMMALDDFRSNLKFKLVSFERGSYKRNYVMNWQELGSRFLDYYKGYFDSNDRIKALASQVTANCATEGGKSQALYEHVVNSYHTSFEYNGNYMQNERMSRLLDTRTGTAEEKNVLLVSLHQAAGLEAHPVLLGTRDRRRLDGGSPDFRQFNYIVAYVQFSDHFEFLDASSRYIPYGLIPPDCLAEGGLLLDADTSTLVKIMPRETKSSRHDVTRLTVQADGEVTAALNCGFAGYYAAGIARRFDRTDPEEFVKDEYLEPLGIQYNLDSVTTKLESSSNFEVNVQYASSDLVRVLDENMLLKTVSYAFRENPFQREQRSFPIDFNYPFKYENRIEIASELPVKQYLMPRDTTINLGDAFLKRTSQVSDSGATLEWHLVVRYPEFPVNNYVSLRELFAQLALWGNEDIILVLDNERP